MTEKRFQVMIDANMQSFGLSDDLKDKHYFSFDDVVDLLNKLSEENMLLKEKVGYYKLLLMSLEEEAKKIGKIR
jgi:chromosome condensin MukBEF ATPase and DNA-binding subunit MukB